MDSRKGRNCKLAYISCLSWSLLCGDKVNWPQVKRRPSGGKLQSRWCPEGARIRFAKAPAAEKHPENINPLSANAKLISANHETNFTYRGDLVHLSYPLKLTNIVRMLIRPSHPPPSANIDKFRPTPSCDIAKVLKIRRKNRDVCVL